MVCRFPTVTETPDPKHGERFKAWMASGTGDPNPAIPAATVILLRDSNGGIETLMLRRNSKIAFGGMWVFPGGRVEEGDDDGTADDSEALLHLVLRRPGARRRGGHRRRRDPRAPVGHAAGRAVVARRVRD